MFTQRVIPNSGAERIGFIRSRVNKTSIRYETKSDTLVIRYRVNGALITAPDLSVKLSNFENLLETPFEFCLRMLGFAKLAYCIFNLLVIAGICKTLNDPERARTNQNKLIWRQNESEKTRQTDLFVCIFGAKALHPSFWRRLGFIVK